MEPAALALVARAAEGSLRDAESSLDQVIAFAGEKITAADVGAVLGLVGRDLLLDIVETVADEDAARVFDLAARAVESGQDLRLVCRELSRVVRDMMVASIDPSRAKDPDFAPEGDVERLTSLAARFSREDLLRAFDVVARAEFEVRTSAQPRYHLEMALLKWIHLRKVQPLAELLQALGAAGRPADRRAAARRAPARAASPEPPRPTAAPRRRTGGSGQRCRLRQVREPGPAPRRRLAPSRRIASSKPSSRRSDRRRSCCTAPSWRRRSASTLPASRSRSASRRSTASSENRWKTIAASWNRLRDRFGTADDHRRGRGGGRSARGCGRRDGRR